MFFTFSISAQTLKTSISLEEQFVFKTYDNKFLAGTLTIPEKNDSGTPIVIFVTSPLPCDRNCNGIFIAMADSLAQNGIASLRFDNRSFSDSASQKLDADKYTMYDVAKDVHEAYLSLRNDSKFKNSPIGLLGHSEGELRVLLKLHRILIYHLLLHCPQWEYPEKRLYTINRLCL